MWFILELGKMSLLISLMPEFGLQHLILKYCFTLLFPLGN